MYLESRSYRFPRVSPGMPSFAADLAFFTPHTNHILSWVRSRFTIRLSQPPHCNHENHLGQSTFNFLRDLRLGRFPSLNSLGTFQKIRHFGPTNSGVFHRVCGTVYDKRVRPCPRISKPGLFQPTFRSYSMLNLADISENPMTSPSGARSFVIGSCSSSAE